MMWLVRLALRRPISVAVMALLMLVLGTLSFFLMNIDIFPTIDIPVAIVVWSSPGRCRPKDMERRVVLITERAFSTTVNGISRLESQSISGHRPHSQGVLRAGDRHRERDRADHRACRTRSRASCHRASHPRRRSSSTRVERPGRADQRWLQRTSLGVADLRLRAGTSSACGCSRSPVSRRLLPWAACNRSGDGEYRSDRVSTPTTSQPHDVGTSLADLERDHSVRHRAHGPLRIQRRHQHEPDERLPSSISLPVKIVNGAPVLLGDVAIGHAILISPQHQRRAASTDSRRRTSW